jgi:hypothetical protein
MQFIKPELRWRVTCLVASAFVSFGGCAVGETLSSRDQLDWETIALIFTDADRFQPESSERVKLMQELLQKSKNFADRHPDHLRVWGLRAAAALETKDQESGIIAAGRLLSLGVLDEQGPTFPRKILAKMHREDWFNPAKLASIQSAIKQREDADVKRRHRVKLMSTRSGRISLWTGQWVGAWSGTHTDSHSHSGHRFEINIDVELRSKIGKLVLGGFVFQQECSCGLKCKYVVDQEGGLVSQRDSSGKYSSYLVGAKFRGFSVSENLDKLEIDFGYWGKDSGGRRVAGDKTIVLSLNPDATCQMGGLGTSQLEKR